MIIFKLHIHIKKKPKNKGVRFALGRGITWW
jgi:hypothetical protein